MFLLGLLAAAFLPLLVQGLKQSAANATLATATQLANDQIELARSATKCTELTASTTTTVDPRNVPLLVVRTVGASCAPTRREPGQRSGRGHSDPHRHRRRARHGPHPRLHLGALT